MSEELPKYEDFTATDVTELWRKTNRLSKKGYKILETIPIKGRGGELFLRNMYLSSSVDLTKYEGYVNAPIGSEEQQECEALGCIPVANYSKHITWATLKKPQPRLSVIGEAIVNAIDTLTYKTDQEEQHETIARLQVALDEIKGTNKDDEPNDTGVQG